MRILIATGLYPPDIGGPATYSKFLFDELPKHGLDVGVVSFGMVRRLPKVIRHVVYFFYIIRQGARADIIYALDPVSVGLPSMLASLVLRKRFFVRVAGDYAWEQYVSKERGDGRLINLEEFQRNKYDFVTELRRKLEYLVVHSAEKIIVPSHFLKKIIVGWRINQDKIKVIHNGFNGTIDYGKKQILRDLLQFQGRLIISAGRLIPLKGFTELVKVIGKLHKRFPGLKLFIVGNGPQQKRLENVIQKLKLEDSVILAGALAREVLLQYIRAADIFVLNSIHETFPHVILEAMAIGTPIIATKVGGTPEIVRNNKEALLISFGDQKGLADAIKELLENSAKRAQLVQGAKIRIKEFSEEKMIAKIVQEFKN